MRDRPPLAPSLRGVLLAALVAVFMGSLAWGCTGSVPRPAEVSPTPTGLATATATPDAWTAAFMHNMRCTDILLWFSTRPALPPSSTNGEMFSQLQRGRQVERDLTAAACPLNYPAIERWVSDVTLAIFWEWNAPAALNVLLANPMANFVAETDTTRQEADLEPIHAVIRAWNEGANSRACNGPWVVLPVSPGGPAVYPTCLGQ